VADRATAVKGAKLRRTKGVDQVVVKVGEMFEGGPPTITQLAEALRLEPRVVLDAIVGYGSNEVARHSLFDDNMPVSEPEPANTRDERQRLLKAAVKRSDAPGGRSKVQSGAPYKGWKVDPAGDQPVVLPLSRGFRGVLARAQKVAEARERLIKLLKPSFDILKIEMGLVKLTSDLLGNDLARLDRILQPAKTEYFFIETIQRLLATMGASPKGLLFPSDEDPVDVAKLSKRVDELARVAYREMILDPPDESTFPISVRQTRKSVADNAKRLRETLSSAVKNLKLYRDHHDLAPAELHELIAEVLEAAYTNLLNSPLSEDVIREEVVPLLDLLASVSEIEVPTLDDSKHDPDFLKGLRERTSVAEVDSALVIVGGLAATTPLVIGNFPGPASLSVAIISLSEAQMQKALGLRANLLRQMSGKLTRAAFVLGRLSPQRFEEVIDAITSDDLARLAKMNWSQNIQQGPRMAGFMSILFFITLCQSITSDDSESLRKIANVVGSAGATSLGVSQALSHLSVMSKSKIVTGLAYGKVGNAVGGIAGAAAIVSAGVTVKAELQDGDMNGAYIAGAGGLAGIASVVGFLMTAGLIAEGTIAGAPAGLVLQGLGALVGLMAGLVAFVRDFTTAGTHKMFEELLLHVGRDGGLLQRIAAVRPSLATAFNDVKDNHASLDFWDIDKEAIQMLADFGFSNEQIAKLIDESEDFINNNPPKRKPIA